LHWVRQYTPEAQPPAPRTQWGILHMSARIP
jgi:hypothetical protein